jgi:heterodisulfide reductase subunit A-like polyferredoxin
MQQNGNVRIGVYICHCGANIASTVKVDEVRQFISSAPGVVVAAITNSCARIRARTSSATTSRNWA